MREVLFKGKRKDNGEWVEGFYVKHGSRHYIYTGEVQYLVYPANADLPTKYEVNPETVCQYTGLTDNTKWEQLSDDEKEKFLSEWNHKENRQNIKDDWSSRKIFEGNIVRLTISDSGAKSPFGAKPTQVWVFASLLATPHIVFGWFAAPF